MWFLCFLKTQNLSIFIQKLSEIHGTYRGIATFAVCKMQILCQLVPPPVPPLILSRCLDPRSSGPPRSGFLSVISNTFERGMNLKLLGKIK